jgi:hypothetical protein
MSEQKIVEYKGHRYTLLWTGETKFGHKCKLQFMDGSKQFWVPSNQVHEPEQVAPQPRGMRNGRHWGRCWECGCEGWLDSDGYCGC